MKALTEPEPEPEKEDAAPLTPKLAAAPVKQTAVKATAPYYTPTKLKDSVVSAEELVLPKYAAGIRKKIEAVISNEAPISKALLMRRVVQSYGITRAGTRIQAHFDTILDRLNLCTSTQEDQIFFWHADQDPETYDIYRPALSEETRRDAKETPVQEAAAAICQVLADQISLNQDDLVREGAKLMGYTRLGTSVTNLFTNAIRFAVWKGRIIQGTNGNWTISK
jgi:hypothetical protein